MPRCYKRWHVLRLKFFANPEQDLILFDCSWGDRDHEKLEAQMPMYDALYAWCREGLASEV